MNTPPGYGSGLPCSDLGAGFESENISAPAALGVEGGSVGFVSTPALTNQTIDELDTNTKKNVWTSFNEVTGVQNRITMRKNTIDVEMSIHGRKNGSFVKQFDTEEEKLAFITYQMNYLKKNGFDPAVESSVSLVAKDTMDIANIDVEDDSQPGVIDTGRVDSGNEGIGREDSEYESSDSDKEDEEEYKETHEEQETYDEFLNKLNKQRTTRK